MYMVIRRLLDGKFMSPRGYMNNVTDAEFFTDEIDALRIAQTATEYGTASEVVYVTITLSNVKG